MDTKNLDQLRDEKCFPIVREIFKDVAGELIQETETPDYNPLILKMLKKTLEADLNITIEVSYVFQVILGMLSGLNSAIQRSSPVKIDDARYASIARRILTIVSDANVRLGSVTVEESKADFEPVVTKVNDLFLAENLSFVEIKYVMDSIFESFKNVNNLFSTNLESSIKRMEAKVLGIGSMDELTMQKLNSVLITPEESKTV